MKVLLISANRLAEPYPVYPIGLDYVRGALAPEHDVEVLDLAVQEHHRALPERLRDGRPDLIGVALRNIDNTEALDTRTFGQDYRALIEEIRACSTAPIVLGGPAFTIAPRPWMDFLGAEYGIVGEGERLAELARALERSEPPDELPGLVRVTGEPNPPQPLGDVPDRALPASGPQLAHYVSRSGMMNLQTQRGCPYRCVYCTYPLVEGRRQRTFPPADVARQAKRLEALGARFIFVTDAVFNADEAHGLAVAQALREVGLGIPWGAYFAPRTTEPSYWRALAEAGLSHVEFGTDSLDDDVLGRYRKPFTAARVLEAHGAALAAGLHVAHFFTLGGPGESEATVRRTFEAARGLERCVCFFFAGARIYPGTELARLHQGGAPLPDGGLTPTFYEPPGWSLQALGELAAEEIGCRRSWLLGSGGPRLAKALSRFYDLGYTGPLWEKLVR